MEEERNELSIPGKLLRASASYESLATCGDVEAAYVALGTIKEALAFRVIAVDLRQFSTKTMNLNT